MTDYEKVLALWKQKDVKTDAELAEALNGHSIAYAYHSGKIENDRITDVKVGTLLAIANALETTIDCLFFQQAV